MIHNILDYGATGDGVQINTGAIQAAIDACKPGDTVKIPAGIFRSGALFLKGNMTFSLAEGATLLGSGELKDYPILRYRFEGREQWCYASLLNTEDMKNPSYESGDRISDLILEGPGNVDANGSVLKRRELECDTAPEDPASGIPVGAKLCRGRAVALRNVDHLTLRNMTICHGPAWCVHLIYCKDVLLDGVHIRSKFAEDGSRYDIFNGDGLDPDSCCRVEVRNCLIESQDDCIAVKSGRDEEGRQVGIPCEDIHIHDCTFRYGFGVAMGSEMSGGVRNVLTENCRFEDTFSIASVKAPRGRGAVVENITYRNCTHRNRDTEHVDCKWFRGSIYVDQFYGIDEFDSAKSEAVTDGTPKFRNLVFENIETDTIGGHSLYFCGLPESPIENVTLKNVRAHGKKGAFFANTEGMNMTNVEISSEE